MWRPCLYFNHHVCVCTAPLRTVAYTTYCMGVLRVHPWCGERVTRGVVSVFVRVLCYPAVYKLFNRLSGKDSCSSDGPGLWLSLLEKDGLGKPMVKPYVSVMDQGCG